MTGTTKENKKRYCVKNLVGCEPRGGLAEKVITDSVKGHKGFVSFELVLRLKIVCTKDGFWYHLQQHEWSCSIICSVK